MNLDIKTLLSPLDDLLNKIGAKEVNNYNFEEKIIIPDANFTLELKKYPELEIKIIESLIQADKNFFSIDGRPCVLYIPYGDLERMPVFHVTKCSSVNSMYEKGRMRRYVATDDTSGIFKAYIASSWRKRDYELKYIKLKVCKTCLTSLNYKGYRKLSDKAKQEVVDNFNLQEFFDEQNNWQNNFNNNNILAKCDIYPTNWPEIARAYKERRRWRCEACGVDLSDNKSLLHAHHVNGLKFDNSPENIKVLCALCHSEQPYHAHMQNVSNFAEARRKILNLRIKMREQLRDFLNLKFDII